MKVDIGDAAQLRFGRNSGIALHILRFLLPRYIAKFDWENVHASWFIVYA